MATRIDALTDDQQAALATHAAHWIDPGAVCWRVTAGSDRLELGTVTVPDGAVAHLIHPEHGAQGIGAGTYRIRRQREQADEIRMVAD